MIDYGGMLLSVLLILGAVILYVFGGVEMAAKYILILGVIGIVKVIYEEFFWG